MLRYLVVQVQINLLKIQMIENAFLDVQKEINITQKELKMLFAKKIVEMNFIYPKKIMNFYVKEMHVQLHITLFMLYQIIVKIQ